MKFKFCLPLIMISFAAAISLGLAGCKHDGFNFPEAGNGENKPSGTVSITVNVNGKFTCGDCNREYNNKEAAENCEHYKCSECGTVYMSEADQTACTSHVTVTFTDGWETEAERFTKESKTIKSNTKATPPSWSRDTADTHYELKWKKESDDADLIAAITEDTTFTATWTQVWVCENCGKAYYTESDVSNCAEREGCPKYEAHCSFCDKTYDKDSDAANCTHYVCEVCGTAYKNETDLASCTAHPNVTFEDADDENPKRQSVSVKIKSGDTVEPPAWSKENFNLSWDPEIGESITADATYKAVWTEKPKCKNCGTHYDDVDDVDNCGVGLNCPNFVRSWTAETSTSIPGWIKGLTGTVDTKNDHNAFGLTKHIDLAANASITITPPAACTIKVYIANDNNTPNKGTVTATVEGAKVGDTYSLPNRKNTTATPMVVSVTGANAGKEFVFTPTYNSLVYKVELVIPD